MSRLKQVGAAIAISVSLPVVMQAEIPAPASVENAFLDVLPQTVVPDEIQPIPGAVNEEFRNCREFWPAGYAQARSGPEARALRDIYSFVRAQNVIETRDCSCIGKVASWAEVDRIATELRQKNGVERLTWQQTAPVSQQARRLIGIAETMCGGSF